MAEQKFSVENQWSAHEAALALCNAEKLQQTVYFLNRDLAFMKEVFLELPPYLEIYDVCVLSAF